MRDLYFLMFRVVLWRAVLRRLWCRFSGLCGLSPSVESFSVKLVALWDTVLLFVKWCVGGVIILCYRFCFFVIASSACSVCWPRVVSVARGMRLEPGFSRPARSIVDIIQRVPIDVAVRVAKVTIG